MAEEPLVSIIVPVFNCAKYIKECVDSLIEQSYKNTEIILINDGSTDESEDIIKRYYTDNVNIRYLKKKNLGVSNTRNIGISLAKGDFIAFVDGDDYVSRDFIEVALKRIKEYKLDFVLGGTRRFSGSSYKDYAAQTDDILIFEDDMFLLMAKVISNGHVADERLDHCFTGGPVCKLIDAKLVKNLSFNEELITGEDTIFNLQLLEQTKRAGVVADIWYYYRTNEDSATNRYNCNIKEHYEKTLSVLKQLYGEKEALSPYLSLRAIQQFHGILILHPLHKESGMQYFEKRRFVETMLNKAPWKSLLVNTQTMYKNAIGIDKLLLLFCKNKLIDPILISVMLRLKIKHYRKN